MPDPGEIEASMMKELALRRATQLKSGKIPRK
jgi:hypothetical protein